MYEGGEKSKKSVVSGMFWAYCENITTQFVSFVLSIVLARILEPAHYGTIALVMVFISIANVFVSSSFSYALIQKSDVDELDYNTMFWFNLIVSLVLYSILFFTAPVIASYYSNENLILIIRVLSVRIPVSAYNSIQLAYVSNKMAFKKSFMSSFFGNAFSAIVGIAMAISGLGIWALVLQSILLVIINTVCMCVTIRWFPKIQFSWTRLKGMYSFGWKLIVTGLLYTLYAEVRTLVIGKRYSESELGYYDKGYSFPRFIASNIDSTINRVLFPTLAQEQNDILRLAEMTRRSAKTSAYIMTPILFGLAAVSETLVKCLLTEKWLPCVPYLIIMCFVWWLQPTQSCSIQALKALGKSGLYLSIEIISKVVGIGLLCIAVFIVDSVFAIAVSMLIGQIFAMILYGVFVSKYVGYKLVHQIQDLLIPALMGVIMAVGVEFVNNIVDVEMLSIIVQIIVGGIIYIVLSIVIKYEAFIYLINTFKQMLKKNKV